MKYETYAPLFPGFYNTVFECYCEDSAIQYYNEENGTDYKYDSFNWDYADYNTRIAKAFINRLETELNHYLPVKFEFQSIYSPKEYNFTNDSINVLVDVDLNRLLNAIRERYAEAKAYFKEKYTSRSGFISFHSPYIELWLTKDYILEKPKHRIGALLDCICHCELNQDDIIYWCDNEMFIQYTLNEAA